MNKEILQKAIDKWGKETQINKIQEEALELALVLNQRKCPTKDVEQMEANLYDELADMKIMMAQAEMLFDADRINERVNFKLDKLQSKHVRPLASWIIRWAWGRSGAFICRVFR